MNILLTGHSGFVGSYLSSHLRKIGSQKVYVLTRKFQIVDLETGLLSQNSTFDVVIHCAGTTPGFFRKSNLYKVGNLDFTKKLCLRLSNNIPRQFIFLSTCQVYGNFEAKDEPFHYRSVLNPLNQYSISKLETERFLRQWSKENSLLLNIIRCPLVYGDGCKGLVKLVQGFCKKAPVIIAPNFSGIRSVISILNLQEFVQKLITCKPKLTVSLVSDSRHLTIYDIFKSFGQIYKKKVFCLRSKIIMSRLEKYNRNFRLETKDTFKALDFYPRHDFESTFRRSK